MSLLDQEAPAALRAEAAHDVELGLRQAEAVDVFLAHRLQRKASINRFFKNKYEDINCNYFGNKIL